ncbi:hypothetical protein [Herbaspirillum sp. CAH-3]|uniref:hypothetical protein n=1 Tax=Herbaspirillum sp. CAH-3 TaxID=2605746 RepID=UPI0012AD1378|nr:hypothetical protein [Herbaspirillum sp. CAH-3]MRT27602.1 hypothetical protein [Herbaspirillum sp. CAH-3]
MEKASIGEIGFLSTLAAIVGAIWARILGLDLGDVATWLSAIFTGLAFGGTLVIATQSERRRKAELHARGVIAVPALIGYVRDMKAHTGAISHGAQHLRKLHDAYGDENWKGFIAACQIQMAKIQPIPDSYLQDIVVVSAYIAGQLHAAQAQIRGIRTYMDAAVTTDRKERKETADFLLSMSQPCADRLIRCHSDLEALAEKFGFGKI